jgi:hypothetical protein
MSNGIIVEGDGGSVMFDGDGITIGECTTWSDATSSLAVDVEGEQVEISEFIKTVREALGQNPVIIKCKYCGQWGAKYCACRYCGAPVG